MSELLKFLSDNPDGCSTAIIEKFDRLARDLVIHEGILAKFQRLSLTVMSTCESDLCSHDPSKKFVRQASTFASAKELSSWVGACSGEEESAGINYGPRSPILQKGIRYKECGPTVCEKAKRVRTARMIRTLRTLGYRVEPLGNPA